MKIEFWTDGQRTRLTRTQAYNKYPHLKEDVESELKQFKEEDCRSMKLSYMDGLQVWAEKNSNEVKNENKGFQTGTEQSEGLEKKKVVQESCN